ncbi:hypothetical protein XELAEV_18017198mg [Xenopus laevis]|uniref:Uncharacterized protein n=1 Tax=Xenopus laevis TaxID=8355 RepID=A0A974DAR3_XENLA|nr:hypothetical protein XELAEV_18017198mg [Xenopus laevis]
MLLGNYAKCIINLKKSNDEITGFLSYTHLTAPCIQCRTGPCRSRGPHLRPQACSLCHELWAPLLLPSD